MSTIEIQNGRFCEETIRLKNVIEGSFIELGERLYRIREGNLFEPQWESFQDFTMELRMSPTSVSRIISIYEIFVLRYAISKAKLISAGGWSVLSDTLPLISSKSDAVKWVEKCGVLSRSDIRREITEVKTGIQMRDCAHKRTITLEVCLDCGDRRKIGESKKI